MRKNDKKYKYYIFTAEIGNIYQGIAFFLVIFTSEI